MQLHLASRSEVLQGHVSQPVPQEASASDSDICSECSTSDSDIPDEKEAGNATSPAACGTNGQSDSCARRQPTLVQHAAAATIQRRFRQQLHTRRQDCNRDMQPCPGWKTWSTSGPVKFIAEASAQQQHQAASRIQAWWRRQSTITRVQMAAPSTPPCSNMQASSASKHSSRPDSASSSSQTGRHARHTNDCQVHLYSRTPWPMARKECVALELQVCYRLDRSRTPASVQHKLLLKCVFRQAGCCRIEYKHLGRG